MKLVFRWQHERENSKEFSFLLLAIALIGLIARLSVCAIFSRCRLGFTMGPLPYFES